MESWYLFATTTYNFEINLEYETQPPRYQYLYYGTIRMLLFFVIITIGFGKILCYFYEIK